MWRGYYHNWIGWERKFFKTRPGRKDERLALYKMRKWRAQYMAYFRARIRYYDKKVRQAKKGSRLYEARWNYAMVYRYYYLYGLKRATWFQGRQLRRYKKGSKNWLKVYRARARSFRTQVYFRERAAWPRARAGRWKYACEREFPTLVPVISFARVSATRRRGAEMRLLAPPWPACESCACIALGRS